MAGGLDNKLKRLRGLENANFPILSIYLGCANEKTATTSLFKRQLLFLVKHNLSKTEQEIFKKDIEQIKNQLNHIKDRKCSRVFFSSGDNLWEKLAFDFYLPPVCLVSYSPYTQPIIEALRWI